MTKDEFKTIIQIQKRGGATLEQAKTIIAPMIDMTGVMEYSEAFELLDKLYKGGPETLSSRIQGYIDSVTECDINVTILDNMLGIVTERDKANRRQIMKRLVEDGHLLKTKSGIFTKESGDAPEIDIDNFDSDAYIKDIKLPFGLHNFVKVFPKNIIMFAGKSNSGKSTILCNILKLNNASGLPMTYFNSEMGGEELKDRIENLKLDKRNFDIREWDGLFASVIKPNNINVIDYLELTENYFRVAQEFKDYTKKLKRGIVIVAMQKKGDVVLADGKKNKYMLADGGDKGIAKPRLYLSVDYDETEHHYVMTVIKHKNPLLRHPLHPEEWVYMNNWKWRFRCINGVDIEIIEDPPKLKELRELVRRTGMPVIQS